MERMKVYENTQAVHETHGGFIFVPLSDIIGVGEIDSRINPHYYHPRNMPCIWILIRVPVNCRAWKVSEQCSPGSCYLKKYFGFELIIIKDIFFQISFIFVF
jgi:hypothetical protein